MDILKIKARPRSGSGKSYTRKARVLGWIPAIYYGRNRQPKTIEIDANEFIQFVRAKKTRNLFNLGLTGEEGGDASQLSRRFSAIRSTGNCSCTLIFSAWPWTKSNGGMPIELTGLPPIGVKEMGGVLQHPAKVLMVECLPANIPEKIAVDVSLLKIGDSIHVRDIAVVNGVIKDSPDQVVAVVIIPTAKEVKAPEPAAAEGVEGAEGAVPAEGAEGAAEGAAPAEGAEGAAAKPGAPARPGRSREN